MPTIIDGSTGVTFPAGGVGNPAGTVVGTTDTQTLTNKTISVSQLSGTTSEANGGTGTTTGYYGFKNRIINGAMMIDQRNAGASVTPTSGQFLVDRFYATLTQASKFTAQQNAGAVTPPAGFIKYLGCTSSSAYSVAAGDLFTVSQQIEGLNVADLGWGTANAQAVTLSFWVRSSLTGTFAGNIQNYAQTYSYVFTYSISSANTWTYVTITVPGQTAGVWATDNTSWAYVRFNLGIGSTYQTASVNQWVSGNYWGTSTQQQVVGTNGATFYITGVQLEKGSTATSFDYRPYGTELALCQRYYEVLMTGWAGYIVSGQVAGPAVPFAVTKRATPTMAQVASLNASGFASGVGSYYVTGTYGVALYHTATVTGNCSWVDQTSASAEL